MNGKNKLAAVAMVYMAVMNIAVADSAKLINPNNSRTYQRFDTVLTWSDAKAACSSSGGHLATITSQEENDWVWTNLGVSGVSIWLGGTDEAQEGVWKWITGEVWNYSKWGAGQPDNSRGDQNYLTFWDSVSNQWDDGRQDNNYLSYICEWESTNKYFDVTAIPDVNSDGVTDQALLVLSTDNYYLRIINGATGKQLKQIILGSGSSLMSSSALTVVDDTNGNGYQEISVLITKADGTGVLQLRDSLTGALVKTFNLLK
jgi:hypothetical protein